MKDNSIAGKQFDLQGHRGARGLRPENTIPAFLLALDIGVTTLEMDAAISSDGEVIISHEPWMSSWICSHPDGTPVTETEEKSLRLFEMTADSIATYDCGLRGHPGFPEQQKMEAFKPKLSDVIEAVNDHVLANGYAPPRYNIEIKSTPDGDSILHPTVDEYASALYDVLRKYNLLEMADVQSFDSRALETMHQIDGSVGLVWLISNEAGLEENLSRLSFTPQIYSPNHGLVDSVLVDGVHKLGMKLIPWTINEVDRMKELIAFGIDGLITDYPDRTKALIEELNK